MKGKIAAGFIAVMMFATVVGLAAAQTTKATHKKTRTLTGCLQKGEGDDEYNLTTKGGATWEIKSDSVKLDDHVGHTVAVTGVVSHHKEHAMKEDAKAEMKDAHEVMVIGSGIGGGATRLARARSIRSADCGRIGNARSLFR